MPSRLSILGRHPDLEPGFNGGMSVTEALGFEETGCDVTLLLPTSTAHDPHALLAKKGYASFDDLPRYGGHFNIEPLEVGGDLGDPDYLVWQTYNRADHPLLESLAGGDFLKTKLPPRLFVGELVADERKASGMLKFFDLIATSLQADREVAQEFSADIEPRFQYVPRGFHPEWLTGATRDEIPTVGLDRAVKADDGGMSAARHIIDLGLRLNATRPDIRFLSMRAEIAEIGSIRVPNLPLRKFYDEFLNRLWLYMPIDLEKSVHAQGMRVAPDGERKIIGLYENQIVEAQLAGGLVIVQRDQVARELVFLPDESIVENYADSQRVLELALEHIENFQTRSAATRTVALERHNHVTMARTWLGHLESLAR